MRLKIGLLTMILENNAAANKYSKAYLNLKNVFDLETKDNFEFTKEFKKKFEKITNKYKKFINDIPLSVIEKYYLKHVDDLESYVYLEYKNKELEEYKTIDLYVELENFFNEIFALSCEIANYYNLEVKLNNNNDSKTDFL